MRSLLRLCDLRDLSLDLNLLQVWVHDRPHVHVLVLLQLGRGGLHEVDTAGLVLGWQPGNHPGNSKSDIGNLNIFSEDISSEIISRDSDITTSVVRPKTQMQSTFIVNQLSSPIDFIHQSRDRKRSSLIVYQLDVS